MPDPSRPGGTHKIERTFRTKQEAEDWIASQRVSILRGSYIDARQGDRPFRDLLDAWKESWSSRLSPTTQRRYQSIIDNYLAPEFGPVQIGRITHEVVQRYIMELTRSR